MISLVVFIAGALLFALASPDSTVAVDAYTIASALLSTGGGGFFLSHFIIAEHFRGSGFGLVHALINGAFDGSTITMVALEALHSAGLSLGGCFLTLASVSCLYLMLSFDIVWQGMLAPPRDAEPPLPSHRASAAPPRRVRAPSPA